MNAIEMMFEKALPGLLAKLVENLPPEVLGNIGQMGQIAVGLKAQLDRIEAQNLAIMSHLNINANAPHQPKEIEHVRTE